MVIRIIAVVSCLLGAGSVLCTWLGQRMDSLDWFLRAGSVCVIQLFVLAVGLLTAVCGFIGDFCHKRGLRVCLKRAAWLAVMIGAWMIAVAYHVVVTGGV